MMKISIIVTIFNRYTFLAQLCKDLDDLVLSKECVYEVVFYDDASNDGSFDFINAYVFNNRDKIRAFRGDKNKGQFGARNFAVGLMNSACQYIKFIDSDDLPYLHTIEDFLSAFAVYPDYDLYVSSSKPHDVFKYPFVYEPRAIVNDYLNSSWITEGPSSWFLSRALYDKIGGFDVEGAVNEDIVFLLKSFFHGSCVVMRPSNIWYRRHENQALVIGSHLFEYEKNEWRLDYVFNMFTQYKYKNKLRKIRLYRALKQLLKLNWLKFFYILKNI